MITVIIPTCDRPAEFLREAIDSVLAQTLPPSEVIVVDNGTRDADPAALPDGVTLYRLPPRVGPSRARNFGAAMAKGTHLAFLDDDDWWENSFLEKCSKVLLSQELDCVYSGVHSYSNGLKTIKYTPNVEDLTVHKLLKRNTGASGSNFFICKEVFWKIGGFDEKLKISEDRDLGIRLLLSHTKLGFCDKTYVTVREHSGDRLTNKPPIRLRFLLKYHDEIGLILTLKLFFLYLAKKPFNLLKKFINF